MTLSITTLSINAAILLNVAFSYCYAENDHAECRYVKCHYAECHGTLSCVFTGNKAANASVNTS